MSRYELRFANDGERPAKTVRFAAPDASMALILAHRHAPDRPAELWQDDRKLCTIRRQRVDHSDVWIIGGRR
jgi:hypothetical protein